MTPVVLFTNSPAMGGMEEHVLHLAGGLAARGVRTAVVCSSRPEIEPLRDALVAAGVQVHTPRERASMSGAAQRLRQLRDVFRPYSPGILHVHSTGFHGGDLVMLAGRAARMGAIVRTEHVPPQPPFGPRERAQVRARDRLLVDRVICVCEANRREHVELLGRSERRFAVIPNGIDVDRFVGEDGSGVHGDLGLDPATPIVGTVARLAEERKGIHHFVTMAAAVGTRHPGAHFVVVGDGPLRPALEAQAGRLGIDRQVTFLGTRHDVPRLVAAMQVFVMPSLYEAGPLTLLEAMASARAVVATPVGVAPDVIVDGDNGLLVPLNDPDALGQAVVRLLDDPATAAQLGARARATARESFSASTMVDQTLELYTSLVDDRG